MSEYATFLFCEYSGLFVAGFQCASSVPGAQMGKKKRIFQTKDILFFKKFSFLLYLPEKDAWPCLNYGILVCFVCVDLSIL